MDDILVRQLSCDDLDELEEIEQASFSIPWSRESYAQELSSPHRNGHYLGCFLNGRLIAYGGFWQILDEGHIGNIAVRPGFRGRGYGELITRHLIINCQAIGGKRMTLEVRKSNTPAISLYSKLGFKQAGLRPHYYHDNHEDAIIMWLEIN